METLLIKLSEKDKANMLVELLRSMDFVESVDYMGDLKYFQEAFDKACDAAAATDLKNMTMDDINNEIKAYRLEKNADKLSSKYKGILKKEDGEKLNEHVKQMRGEWN